MGRHLFTGQGALDEDTADKNQLAQMVALLGPTPEALLADSGPRALEFFNEDGSAKGRVPNETLESVLASSLEHVEETIDGRGVGSVPRFYKTDFEVDSLSDPWDVS